MPRAKSSKSTPRKKSSGAKKRGAGASKKKASAKPKRQGGWRSGTRRVATATGGVLALGGTLALLWVGVLYLSVVVEVKAKMEGQRWELPTQLHAKPLVLEAGGPAPAGDLGDLLITMGYSKRDRVQRSGEFRSAGAGRWYIFPYDAPHPGRHTLTQRLDLVISKGKISSLSNYDAKKRLSRVELPGLPFAQLHQGAREARRIYDLADFSEHLRQAVVAIEDERFFSHGALDPIGLTRAILVNITSGKLRQGGSTLTQQAAKNFFLTHERTLSRKLKEVLYSVALESNYSKDEILELYLNEIYLGQSGSLAICGMGEAAYHFFSRKPAELSLSEAALLAGMIKAPNALDPTRHKEKATKRRNVVLAKMAELGYIDDAAKKSASAEEIHLRQGKSNHKNAPWFVDHVLGELREATDTPSVAGAGLSVRTTLDWRVQRAAERAMERGLKRLGKKDLQGAIVVLDPPTGHILALVGGRSWEDSQFNRALNAHRQPGSAFKPMVYAAAFRTLGQAFGPSYIMSDEAITLTVDGKRWSPSNFDHSFHGDVTAREALERSLNVATVDLAQEIGINNVVNAARAAGITSACAQIKTKGDDEPRRDCNQSNPAWQHPSLALGSKEVTPIELARAYTAIATDGRVRPTSSVLEVLASNGEQIYGGSDASSSTLLPSDAAWMLRDMMAGVIDEGTAKSVRSAGYNHRASGKTGTTNEERDAWFVGFDRELLAVVWVGYDDNRSTGFTGGRAAAPIWADMMAEVRRGRPPPTDPAPSTVVIDEVCLESGAIASRFCPQTVEEVFFAGRVSQDVCPIHGRPIEKTRKQVRGWLERLFGGEINVDIQISDTD